MIVCPAAKGAAAGPNHTISGKQSAMNSRLLHVLSVAILVAWQLGCTEPGSDPGTPSSQALVASGQVLDSQGAPMPGVQVFADNTLGYNSNLLGVTDAQGRYRIVLPEVATTWKVTASITHSMNGEEFRFDMHPDNPAAFAGVDGGVRNFRWRMSGERPDGNVYGNSVWFYGNPTEEFDFDDRELEYMLVPVGPLVDGTSGQTVTRMGEDTGSGWGVGDVPFGRYRISARHAPTGRALRVRLRDQGDYTSSVEGTFTSANGLGTRPYVIEVEVTS